MSGEKITMQQFANDTQAKIDEIVDSVNSILKIQAKHEAEISDITYRLNKIGMQASNTDSMAVRRFVKLEKIVDDLRIACEVPGLSKDDGVGMEQAAIDELNRVGEPLRRYLPIHQSAANDAESEQRSVSMSNKIIIDSIHRRFFDPNVYRVSAKIPEKEKPAVAARRDAMDPNVEAWSPGDVFWRIEGRLEVCRFEVVEVLEQEPVIRARRDGDLESSAPWVFTLDQMDESSYTSEVRALDAAMEVVEKRREHLRGRLAKYEF